MRPCAACNDTYVRDAQGVWRYPWGAPVPGARDLTLSELFVTDPEASTHELASRVRQLTLDEERWLSGEPVPLDRLLLLRRGSKPPHAGDLILGIQAPELYLQAMMTVNDIAVDASVSKATIDSYRYRGYLPEPQVVCGRTPLWARPIVHHWLARRPGCGWRSDVYGETSAPTRTVTAGVGTGDPR